MENNICECTHCDKPAKLKGYCRYHYQRVRQGYDLYNRTVKIIREKPICSELECSKVSYAKGLCKAHYEIGVQARYRLNNKEKVKARAAKWRSENREKANASSRESKRKKIQGLS